jgi:hypothetical protein
MTGQTSTEADCLRTILASSEWLLAVLTTVRDSSLPDAWVGAGAIRDLVWGELFGRGFDPADIRDVDVPFFDPDDLSRDRDDQATELLHQFQPGIPWEAKNQAAVHTWYARKFGGDPVAPLRNIADAVATWPETATTIAVRVGVSGEIEICAPLGLTDLLTGVWRRNPRRVSLDRSRARLARHRPRQRWPGVTVIEP